ncbi:MAG TPA: hypothetical protein EYH08_05220 [Pyrodictium sp.]|nr:hypothetical protein [Pyrodictium sp.]
MYKCDGTIDKVIELDNIIKLAICSEVYEPSDDTWLLIDVVKQVACGQSSRVFVDMGAGTGVVGIYISTLNLYSYILSVDINPCSVLCVLENVRRNGLGHLIDVVQSDNMLFLRCGVEGITIAYNTPYLPVSDEGLLGLAWSGGLNEVLRTFTLFAERCRKHCLLIVVFSSLSGPLDQVFEIATNLGFKLVAIRTKHLFFEKLVCTVFRR